mgnify:FL=1
MVFVQELHEPSVPPPLMSRARAFTIHPTEESAVFAGVDKLVSAKVGGDRERLRT